MLFPKNNQRNNMKKQIEAIRKETDNPAIIQDVTDTEFGVIPGALDDTGEAKLNHVQKTVVRNSVDGKTWNDL